MTRKLKDMLILFTHKNVGLLLLLLILVIGCTATETAVKKNGNVSGVTSIRITENDSSVRVKIEGDRPLSYKPVKQPYPLGLILYLQGAAVEGADISDINQNDIVTSISASESMDPELVSRIEILLKKEVSYRIDAEENALLISFLKNSQQKGVASSEISDREKENPSATAIEETDLPKMEENSPPGQAKNLSDVEAITKDESLEVVVKADGVISDFESFTVQETIENPARIVFDIFHVNTPLEEEQEIELGARWADRVRFKGYKDRIRLVIDTRNEYLSTFFGMPFENGLKILLADENAPEMKKDDPNPIFSGAGEVDSEPVAILTALQLPETEEKDQGIETPESEVAEEKDEEPAAEVVGENAQTPETRSAEQDLETAEPDAAVEKEEKSAAEVVEKMIQTPEPRVAEKNIEETDPSVTQEKMETSASEVVEEIGHTQESEAQKVISEAAELKAAEENADKLGNDIAEERIRRPEAEIAAESVEHQALPKHEQTVLQDSSKEEILLAENVTSAEKIPQIEDENEDYPENFAVAEAESTANDEESKEPEINILSSVSALPAGNGLIVSVDAGGPIKEYNAFAIEKTGKRPARIVVDMYNLESPLTEQKVVPVNANKVRRVRYLGYPDKVRLVIDTVDQFITAFVVNPSRNGLEIKVGPAAESMIAKQDDSKETDARTVSAPPDQKVDSLVTAQSVEREAAKQAAKTPVKAAPETEEQPKKHSPVEIPEAAVEEQIETKSAREVSEAAVEEKNEQTFAVEEPGPVAEAGAEADEMNQKAEPIVEEQFEASQIPEVPETIREKSGEQYELKAADDKFEPNMSLETKKAENQNAPNELIANPQEAPSFQEKTGQPEKMAADAPKTPIFKGHNLVNRIDFSSLPNGKSSLIVGAIHPIRYKVDELSNKKIVVRLFDTKLAESQKRPLITTRFESAVDRVLPIQTSSMKDTILSIELREMIPYRTETALNELRIDFDSSSIPPKPFEEAGLPSWKEAMSQPLEKMVEEEGALTQDKKASLAEEAIDEDRDASGKPRKKYSGEKIALDFFETDIKNVFRILREVSGKNFAIDKDVTGSVTLTLEKPVPWDQVLDLILKMNQLGKVEEGDIIRVAKMSTITKEERDRQAKIAAEAKAKEQEKAVEPLITEYIAVNYSDAKTEILPHLQDIATKERGSLSVNGRTNMVIMTDTAEKIRQAREIVRRLDKVTPQVIIEARIVEASSNFVKRIGIEWTTEGGIPNNDPDAGIGPQRGYDTLGGTWAYDTAVNLPVADSGTIGFEFKRIFGTPLTIDAQLSAMEMQEEGKVVSAPKVMTLDNKKATIKQGREVPYSVVDADGQTNTQFKEVDLLLEVTPHVTPDQRISMRVFITKNEIAEFSVEGVPSLSTKEAETELLVNDGETIVIGGILQTTDQDSVEGVPGLYKLPVLNWLFKRDVKSSRKEELLIFLTPRIMQLEQKNI